jgi:LmbE family N-acetylglucosaminyl deacetylase
MNAPPPGGAKGLLRSLLFPAAEGAWALAFAAAGQLLRPTACLAAPTGADRVLVVAPHPDDETLGCGGAIVRHSRAGDRVSVLVVTDGGSSRAGGLHREQIRVLRAREAAAAIAHLETAEIVQWSLPENRWSRADLRARFAAILQSFRPTLIYTIAAADFHPEHRRVAAALAHALTAGAAPTCRAVRVYELQVPLTPVLANILIDISAVAAVKARALDEYATQRASFAWLPRHARHLRLLYRLSGPHEAFWELPPAQFCRLMAGYAAARPVFHPIRLRPFTDGLAWLRGYGARRRLRVLAEGNARNKR